MRRKRKNEAGEYGRKREVKSKNDGRRRVSGVTAATVDPRSNGSTGHKDLTEIIYSYTLLDAFLYSYMIAIKTFHSNNKIQQVS